MEARAEVQPWSGQPGGPGQEARGLVMLSARQLLPKVSLWLEAGPLYPRPMVNGLAGNTSPHGGVRSREVNCPIFSMSGHAATPAPMAGVRSMEVKCQVLAP